MVEEESEEEIKTDIYREVEEDVEEVIYNCDCDSKPIKRTTYI